MKPLFTLAQLSDLHLKKEDIAARKRLKDCLASVFAMQSHFDALLITGDAIDRSYPQGYTELHDWLSPLNKPYFFIKGNHDAWQNLLAVFNKHHYLPQNGKSNWLISHFPLAIIGLDSIIDDESAGEVSAETLDFLSDSLAAIADDKDIIIALHHPPFNIGIGEQDAVRLKDNQAFFNIVQTDTRIRLLLAGHAHCYVHSQWAGKTAVIAPSAQNSLDYQPRHYAVTQLPLSGGFLLHQCFAKHLQSIHIRH